VFARLDQPLPLGYCNAGVVLEVGEGVTGFQAGDRIVSNGPHAELVCMPVNLCARVPAGVSDDEAAFTVLASVALQGIRLVNPSLGENVVIIGMGLLGLMAAQMLLANGCRVLGIDLDPGKLALARTMGVEIADLSAGADPVSAGMFFSGGCGVDAVLITASTKSSDPVHQAAQMSRKRGRIILVGVTGLELSRADFYEKELSFQVSCSYGPGRYDEKYEQGGQDYPYGFVRWTEQRNFEAVLNLIASGKLDVKPLISQRQPQLQAAEAYRLLLNDHNLLGVLLTYPETGVDMNRTVAAGPVIHISTPAQNPVVGVIGAGNFASQVLIPALKKTAALLKTVASGNDTTAAVAARRFGFQQATSDYRDVLEDPQINTVFIATRHNLHARLVVDALQAGKHVFVEKPLALDRAELVSIQAAMQKAPDQQVMVGFNRRFSPLILRMQQLLTARSQPLSAIYTVNAGAIPPEHWTQDMRIGGGRIIGEGCHFIDLLRFLVGHPITGLEARSMGAAPGVVVRQDKMTILLEFADGSTGAVHYLANGSKDFPKERVEVFSEGRILVMDNFKSLRGFGWKGFNKMSLSRQDKGHNAEIVAFISRIYSGGEPLIPRDDLVEATLASFTAVERAELPPQPLAA
jgi:predicted dehydrogenase/threonine dehydrogenase-like Zn-dependent dehydrogenase